MADRAPYKGRNLDVCLSGDAWIVEITDALGGRSIATARTIEHAINAAYQKIDEEDAAFSPLAALVGENGARGP